ncbi:MAG: hypothetical protein JEY71_11845 [Sphaerochaeta sp.]|nr:hypothetical protein [Sphaerochaeta sp.]
MNNNTIRFSRESKSLKGQTTARLVNVLAPRTTTDLVVMEKKERLLQSDLMQLVFIGNLGRMVIKTMRVTPERVDFYLSAIGQTFDIVIGREGK